VARLHAHRLQCCVGAWMEGTQRRQTRLGDADLKSQVVPCLSVSDHSTMLHAVRGGRARCYSSDGGQRYDWYHSWLPVAFLVVHDVRELRGGARDASGGIGRPSPPFPLSPSRGIGRITQQALQPLASRACLSRLSRLSKVFPIKTAALGSGVSKALRRALLLHQPHSCSLGYWRPGVCMEPARPHPPGRGSRISAWDGSVREGDSVACADASRIDGRLGISSRQCRPLLTHHLVGSRF
jgi:hypothetical protein